MGRIAAIGLACVLLAEASLALSPATSGAPGSLARAGLRIGDAAARADADLTLVASAGEAQWRRPGRSSDAPAKEQSVITSGKGVTPAEALAILLYGPFQTFFITMSIAMSPLGLTVIGAFGLHMVATYERPLEELKNKGSEVVKYLRAKAGKAAEEEEVVVPPKKSLVCPCLGF